MSNQGKVHDHDFAIKAGRAIASERDQLDIRANTAEVRSELEGTIDRLHSRITHADQRSKEHINYYRELYNTWMKTADHHAKRHMCYKVASAALGAAFIISIAIKFVGV